MFIIKIFKAFYLLWNDILFFLIFLILVKKIYFILNVVMVEPLLSGIVLGLVPVTIAGLFVTAYLQYRRGDQATW